MGSGSQTTTTLDCLSPEGTAWLHPEHPHPKLDGEGELIPRYPVGLYGQCGMVQPLGNGEEVKRLAY